MGCKEDEKIHHPGILDGGSIEQCVVSAIYDLLQGFSFDY
jgi:hypothetical protein